MGETKVVLITPANGAEPFLMRVNDDQFSMLSHMEDNGCLDFQEVEFAYDYDSENY